MSDSQCGCYCCPNQRNGEIIAAQVLSIVGWIVPLWPTYIGFIFGVMYGGAGGALTLAFVLVWVSLILMIFYQVLWCVSIPKKLHWAFIIPSFVISGCNFYIAIFFVVYEGGLYSLFYWVPAISWLTAAILQLVFVFKKSEDKAATGDDDNGDVPAAGEDV